MRFKNTNTLSVPDDTVDKATRGECLATTLGDSTPRSNIPKGK